MIHRKPRERDEHDTIFFHETKLSALKHLICEFGYLITRLVSYER